MYSHKKSKHYNKTYSFSCQDTFLDNFLLKRKSSCYDSNSKDWLPWVISQYIFTLDLWELISTFFCLFTHLVRPGHRSLVQWRPAGLCARLVRVSSETPRLTVSPTPTNITLSCRDHWSKGYHYSIIFENLFFPLDGVGLYQSGNSLAVTLKLGSLKRLVVIVVDL